MTPEHLAGSFGEDGSDGKMEETLSRQEKAITRQEKNPDNHKTRHTTKPQGKTITRLENCKIRQEKHKTRQSKETRQTRQDKKITR